MNINLIGVPIYLGSDIKGVNLGPEKLRERDIISVIKKNNHVVYDLGNIYVKEEEESNKFSSHKRMKYIDTIVEVNSNLAHQVYTSHTSGCFPFVVGGDHSLGLGTIAGSSKYYSDLAVVWVDAHGDINTHETSPTGNVHGMPLAAAMGIGYEKLINLYYDGIKVHSDNVFIIGARDLDEGELQLIEKLNLNVWTTEDIKTKGVEKVMEEVQQQLNKRAIKNIHMSFDIDCLDKSLVPGTGTPVEYGLSVNEARYILKDLLQTGLIKSMDFVELNAMLDNEDVTADLAVDLIDWCFKNLK
jgi:arginase